jgi:serine/threonine protein kinase
MRIDQGRIRISDGQERKKNVFEVAKIHFRIKCPVGSGGTADVFEVEDISRNFQNSIIKICRYPLGEGTLQNRRRIDRFEREIEAIKKLNQADYPHVIRLHFDEKLNIDSKSYRYYIMEKADATLREVIQGNSLGVQSRVELCLQVLEGIKELHTMDYYHRDIKPDNVLFVNDLWKISDLGLLAKRNEDQDYDQPNEMIGPRGWLCPEAMNKHLTKDKDVGFEYDCQIDEFSDIFQLGKLFWFIFQCNVPIGQLMRGDFKHKDNNIYQLLQLMLQYDKQRRPSLDKIATDFVPIARAHAVI